ncbi:MAG: glycosyltransferase [Candidatus Delongbacteria bacterium]
MKILFITLKADNAHVLRWVQGALDAGHQPELLCLMPCRPVLDIPTTIIDTDSGPWAKSIGRLHFILACRRAIRRLRPDLVHIHFMDPTLTVLGWIQASPLLVSVWGSDLAMPRSLLNEGFRRLGIRAADCVVATNPLLEYMARAHVGLDAPVEVIPFGVDTRLFTPGADPPDRPFRIGFVKHLEWVYGYDVLIRAVAIAVRRVPDLELHIVGEGNREAEARRLVQEAGLGEVTVFRGRIPNAQLPELLRSYHAFAMPSRSESFGVSALEASACGVPVVASRAGGIPDVVRDGETGFLVPPRDADALAERLVWLAEHPAEARRMGRSGRQLVEREFAWDDCVMKMEAVYRRLTGSAASSRKRPA